MWNKRVKDRFAYLALSLLCVFITTQLTFGQGVMKLLLYKLPDDNYSFKNLKIGDQLPKTPPHLIINYPKAYVDINAFSSKLLILSFWDTYCGVCIEQFPEYEVLQKEFAGRVQILPVTNGKKETIEKFLHSNKITKNTYVPSIVGDSLLSELFKHRTSPHLVWIDASGKVIAITSQDYLTSDRINQALSGNTLNWRMKLDVVNFNYNQPLTQSVSNNAQLTYAIVSPYLNGVRPANDHKTYDTLANTIKRMWVNQPIVSLYLSLVPANRSRYWIGSSTYILNARDSSRFYRVDDSVTYNEWAANNVFSFEMNYPVGRKEEEASQLAYITFNLKFNLNGRIEKRKVNCLVVKQMDKELYPYVESVKALKGSKEENRMMSLASLCGRINGRFNRMPVLNETRDPLNEIPMAKDLSDIKTLRKRLNQSGYDIIMEQRNIDMLVIDEL